MDNSTTNHVLDAAARVGRSVQSLTNCLEELQRADSSLCAFLGVDGLTELDVLRGHSTGAFSRPPLAVCRWAADEIEKLRKKVERLEGGNA